ncbi:MAG: NUDIX hydrolase [Alphaproteobacteria bacterium]
MQIPASIRPVGAAHIEATVFAKTFADAIILTHDNKILLQQRPAAWSRAAGCLTTFGGHIEAGETPPQALIRELKEELGADVKEAALISLGAITEATTNHTELVHGFFWHDSDNTITGCYECEAVYYARMAGALAHPKIMDYVVWHLHICRERGLITA